MEKKCIGMELRKEEIISNYIIQNVSNFIEHIEIIENHNEIRIKLKDNYLIKFLSFIKNNNFLKFKLLLDLFGIDYLDKLQINYYLLSLDLNFRILLKIELFELSVESIIFLYNSANWLEREVWDLYGIYIKNHIDLRRILTDYGFEGHPLLKKFPLSGYIEIFYTNELKKISIKSIELTQEYRVFEFLSPWDINK
jgi:NADH:ubiquinone oxidoreductase subunit C